MADQEKEDFEQVPGQDQSESVEQIETAESDKSAESAEAGETVETLSAEEQERVMAQYEKESNTRPLVGVPKTIMRWLCILFAGFMLVINIGRFSLDFNIISLVVTGALLVLMVYQGFVKKADKRWAYAIGILAAVFILVVNIGRLEIRNIEVITLLPPQVHRSAFVALCVFVTFLLYPANRKNNTRVNFFPWYDLALALIGLACFLYFTFNFETIARQAGIYTTMNVIVAAIGIVILFIACYRVLGLPMMIVVFVFLAYAYFGEFIPGRFGHRGMTLRFMVTRLFYTENGIIGTPVAVVSSFIFAFMIFAAFLQVTGIGQFFIEFATAVAGKATGGPAKVAVIASALTGMISGSSVANTVSSGGFTIPLMKRLGYSKNFAGAVEAAASTGGQITPPTMGAAAFLMAEITGIPFSRIALAALVPAALYFACVFTSVHFEAKKVGLRGLPPEEVPKAAPLILRKGHLLLGLVAIAFFLQQGYTPTRSALYATLISIGLSMIRKDTRMKPKKALDALEMAAKTTISIGVACAMAGLIIGVVLLTGLGGTFAGSMLSLADGIENPTFRLFAVLVFTMLASLTLGLGVPTTAKYVILATITAPILTHPSIGVPMIAAHMFVMFFGTDADITPPVGLASYAAAAISRGDPMRTSVIAMRLAAAGYILPFIFAFDPQMLFVDATFLGMTKVIIAGMVGIIAVAAGLTGYFFGRMYVYERILSFGAGLLMIHTSWLTTGIGIALLALIIVLQLLRRGNNKNKPALA